MWYSMNNYLTDSAKNKNEAKLLQNILQVHLQ